MVQCLPTVAQYLASRASQRDGPPACISSDTLSMHGLPDSEESREVLRAAELLPSSLGHLFEECMQGWLHQSLADSCLLTLAIAGTRWRTAMPTCREIVCFWRQS